jgi:hypothetical protein
MWGVGHGTRSLGNDAEQVAACGRPVRMLLGEINCEQTDSDDMRTDRLSTHTLFQSNCVVWKYNIN